MPAQTSERTSGWRSVFSLGPVYRIAQCAIGAERVRRFMVDEIIRPVPTDRVLDIGAGTGDILLHLDVAHYVGFDPSATYVETARARFGPRGQFEVATVQTFDRPELTDRTLALSLGVLHHVDDDTADELLALARRSLTEGGRFVSFDPTLTDGQHPVARFLVRNDRGQHVRGPGELEAIVRRHFAHVDVIVRHDLLRTPYSHVVVHARA